MRQIIKKIAYISMLLLFTVFTSCEDEPAESNIYEEIIGRGQSFTATMGSLHFRIINNYKSDGGQSVDHVHFHMLGKRSLQWPPG